ncbi:type I DNA topoisomerase [Patescibacteria group bacterium]|nr:type I DNA topoisomerase [Patescibacteria group bacterium]
MWLVIVESPTKARKLKSYLGTDYQIEASVGHVRDLAKNKLSVDVEHNFAPEYQVSEDKQDVVDKLGKLAKTCQGIVLATDPDREGEAIAWHLQQLLKKKVKLFKRATFHEITKSAVLEAIAKPGKIKLDLVDAQQARRILDRLVGYQLSPVLWKKIRRGLSAGRVQSVALRLVVEREREIESFKPQEYWEIDVKLAVNSKENFLARLNRVNGKKFEPKSKKDVDPVISVIPKAMYQVLSVDQKQRQRSSLPPFTTSTLQQSAANRLGMSSRQTMRLAQDLYEEGLITYHRTDSVALSQSSLKMARSLIKTKYGEAYLPLEPRYFKTNSKNAQEAHEAIRVTDVAVISESIDSQTKLSSRHAGLYDLIWRRFVASQMNPAIYDQTSIEVEGQVKSNKAGQPKKLQLRANGSTLVFDGWTRLFSNQEDAILPVVKFGQDLKYLEHLSEQKFTQPPPRYNDASLVKELESRGIGRPSTYASIISVIQERGYIERLEKKFFATAVGMTVCDFLVKNFQELMEYEFTAEMEEDLDAIARGEKKWQKIVGVFYQPFHKLVESVSKDADRVQVPVEKTGKKCPDCGKTEAGEVVIRTGRFGKFLSCSRFPECKYTQNIVNKVKGVKCPLCKEGDVVIKHSRWGSQFYGCGRYPECDWGNSRPPKVGDRVTKAQWKKVQEARAERKTKREKDMQEQEIPAKKKK